MTPALLRNAPDALCHPAVVIGLAEDGGYWLLGLASEVPGVFADIAWSTDAVFAQTLARLPAAGIDPKLLPELADCDRPGDLARWPGLIPA